MDNILFNSYVNYIFSHFEGYRKGQGTLIRNIEYEADKKYKINQKRELFYVLEILLYNNYLAFLDRTNDFIVLTQEGEDYLNTSEALNLTIAFDKLFSEFNHPVILFNELWNFIGSADSEFYVSGPKFYQTIRPYLSPDFPLTYSDYIEEQRKLNESSRIKWYRKLFLELNNDNRIAFLKDLSDVVNNNIKTTQNSNEKLKNSSEFFPPSKKLDSANDEGTKISSENVLLATNAVNPSTKSSPYVLISYSWDNDAHKEWVENLAARLRNEGINAQIDSYQDYGTDLVKFMREGIRKSHKVLVILTPNYKEKAESGIGGASYEGGIISHEIYNQQNTTKFIPILKMGDFSTGCPDFMSSRKGFDFSDPSKLEKNFSKLVKAIKQGTDVDIPPIKD